ncbi:CHAT domain-containing protein, partial [Amylostereum chailletii]
MADEDVQHLSNLRQLDTVQARLDYSARFISQEPSSQADVGLSFYNEFEEKGDPLNIETAIAFEQRALDLTPEGHADKPARLHDIGISFFSRFVRLGDVVDVDSAICLQREAVDLIPEGHTDRPMCLTNLGTSFMRRFERLGDLVDVDSAIRVHREAVELTPEGHANKPMYLNNLGGAFMHQFQRLGDIADVDSAIRVLREAVDLTPVGHAIRPMYLSNLGLSFMRRFERLGDIPDIDSAIGVQREAADLTPDGHADKHIHLNNLGVSFMRRFERLGDIMDIQSAIRVQREAVDLTPEGHANKPMRLNNLGLSLTCQFERLGDVADVDHAIRVQREAVDLTPDGHADKAGWLNNLGLSFMRRFERLGDIADVDSAIRMQREAVRLTPEVHANKPMHLNNLGGSFRCRFERLGDIADVDSAIHVQREAVDLTPVDHAIRPMYLNDLGLSFMRRFERLRDIPDIDSAIRMQREAVDLTPEGHAIRPMYLNNLGLSFMRRFERLGDIADIDSAIRAQCEAVDLTPEGHAAKPMHLTNLGISLRGRFEWLGEMADFHAAVDVFREAANGPSGPPSDRFNASRQWALLLSSPPSTSSPLEAYQVVLALVPRVVWLGSSLHRRYEELPAIAEVVSEAVAAAIAAGDLACALEWLEEGRCVIWRQMLQLRTPLDDLRAVDSALADDLERTSRALDIAGTSQGPQPSEKEVETSMEDEAQKHRRLADKYERMIEKARTLPGCGDFLRPETLAHFRAAANSGSVVVVNISTTRCDAMILLQTSVAVLHVPLYALNREDVIAWKDALLKYHQRSGVRARGMRQRPVAGDIVPTILANLWSKIVQPVLLALGQLSGDKQTVGDLPHLTWCATGPLAFLPLHAAGIYDEAGGPKVFNYVISSYTPTLSALLEAGRRANNHSPTPSVLAVSQLGTGQHSLPGTVEEIAAIQMIVGNHGLHLDGENATKDSVLTAMENHNWIHLACHAHQDIQDPTKSAFILHNSQLDLLSIMQRSFKHTELAFLSACQTATGDEKLTEEVVHLAAGMLMAGYSSVVATMWSIKDKDAPVVAKEFYSRLMEGGHDRRKASYALHAAVRRLRDEVGEKEFVRWVPFIHIGI